MNSDYLKNRKKNQTSVSNGTGNNKPVRFKEMQGGTFKNI